MKGEGYDNLKRLFPGEGGGAEQRHTEQGRQT